ncbi:MAG TPA: dihydrolipoamide acetyltransferase family protein [Zeimonas sp.]
MHELRMPSLGADMEDGVLLEWRIRPGEGVERGAVACVVETQKGAIDVEAWEAGTVARLLAQPGERIAVGTPIAVLADGAEDWRAVASEHERSRETAQPVQPAASPRSSPAARRRAAELGIDLRTLAAQTAGAVVSLADVEAAARETPLAAADAGPTPAASIRAAIAVAMTRANREIPHYHVVGEIEIERAWSRLEAFNRERPIAQRVLFAALALQAIARSLREVPELNGWYRDDALQRACAVHAGIVTSLRGGGIVIPTVHDADRLALPELMEALREAVTRARQGRLRSSDLADSTVTVTNLSDSGADAVYGLVYPPQVALVGLGRIAARPVVLADGAIAARRTMQVTLTADHRASDGLAGARFLSALRERLAQAEASA